MHGDLAERAYGARKLHSQLMATEKKTPQRDNARAKLDAAIEKVNGSYEQLGLHQAAFPRTKSPSRRPCENHAAKWQLDCQR